MMIEDGLTRLLVLMTLVGVASGTVWMLFVWYLLSGSLVDRVLDKYFRRKSQFLDRLSGMGEQDEKDDIYLEQTTTRR